MRYASYGGEFVLEGGDAVRITADWTMGGVSASLAMLGDIHIAEPKALIGFAGPRTIKATIRIELPEGFQTSEFLLEHGMVDIVVDRSELRETLITCLRFMIGSGQPAERSVTAVTSTD